MREFVREGESQKIENLFLSKYLGWENGRVEVWAGEVVRKRGQKFHALLIWREEADSISLRAKAWLSNAEAARPSKDHRDSPQSD